MSSKEEFQKVIEHFGSKAELARALGVHRVNVTQWEINGYFPPKRAIQIEKLTGGKFLAFGLVGEDIQNDIN